MVAAKGGEPGGMLPHPSQGGPGLGQVLALVSEDVVGRFGHANNSDDGSVGVEERGVTLPR